MREFFAREGSPFSDEDAERLGPELVELAEAGLGSPAEIVDYARSTDTPLYEALEMDKPLDDVAEKWYRSRARKVASSIMCRVRTKDGGYRRVRAFYSVVVTDTKPQPVDGEMKEVNVGASGPPLRHRYVSIDQVRDSSAMSEQVLDDALQRLEAWRDRYNAYREVLIRKQPELEVVFTAVRNVTEPSEVNPS